MKLLVDTSYDTWTHVHQCTGKRAAILPCHIIGGLSLVCVNKAAAVFAVLKFLIRQKGIWKFSVLNLLYHLCTNIYHKKKKKNIYLKNNYLENERMCENTYTKDLRFGPEGWSYYKGRNCGGVGSTGPEYVEVECKSMWHYAAPGDIELLYRINLVYTVSNWLNGL